MSKLILSALAVLGFSAAIMAQDAPKTEGAGATVSIALNQKNKMKMTLEEAQKIALRDNPTLASTKARIESAMHAIKQAQAAYYPSLNLGAGMTRLRDQATRSNGTRDWNNTTDYQLGLSAIWSLFDGFQTEFNVLNAKYGMDSAESADLDARRSLLRSVGTAFYTVLQAQDSMDIAKEDAAFNKILLDDAKKRHEGGIAKSSEVLNFVLQVKNADVDYITAERTWRIANVALGALLSITEDNIWENFELLPTEDLSGRHLPFSELYDYALQHRPDYKNALDTISIKVEAIRAAQNTWYPTLDAEAYYGYERTHAAHFNKHLDRDITYGLSLNWNIFNGFATSASIAQAKSDLVSAISDREDLRTQIDSEIRQCILSLESSKKQLDLQAEIVETAKKIRDLVTEEYHGGTTTITRVNEAQTDVNNAASSYSAAKIQLLNSIEALKAVTAHNLAIINE